MKHLIFLCAAFWLLPSFAVAKDKSDAPVEALIGYCLPAIEKNVDLVEIILSKKLPELPPEAAMKFSPGGGRVFAVPADKGNMVIITDKNYKSMCSIAVHKAQIQSFWKAVTRLEKSGFSLMREKRLEKDKITKKSYEIDKGGPVSLLITASDVPRPGAMQILITLARHK